MSAILCRKRSSGLFEDLHHHSLSSSPPAPSKRIRCSSSSPTRFPPLPRAVADLFGGEGEGKGKESSATASEPLDRLRLLFPDMDKETIERAYGASGNDLDSTIRSLDDLRISSAHGDLKSDTSNSAPEMEAIVQPPAQDSVADGGTCAESFNPSTAVPSNGSEWVELFVQEMTHASNLEDARSRASRALQELEKNIAARVAVEASQALFKESLILKEQLEALQRDNNILKRAVTIQHERQKDYDDKNQELHHLKQIISQYQEQVRTLEINNYALTLHLNQAQQKSSIPGQFHPDIF